MATRSMIGIENSDGTIEAIYCHCDGAPEDKGPVLTAFYDSEKKVRELIALGDLSILGEEIGEQHDFDEHWRYLMAHPFRIWCLAYGRDRGDADTKAVMFENRLDYQSEQDDLYLYLFSGGQWFFYPTEQQAWQPLTAKYWAAAA